MSPISLSEAEFAVPNPVLLRALRTHHQVPHLTVVPTLTVVRERLPAPIPRPPNQQELRQRVREVLEVMDGRRPVGQLDGMLPPEQLQRLLAWSRRTPAPRRLRSLHSSRTTETAIDLCATVDSGRRAHALVSRIEVQQDAWRFTLLELV